MPVGSESERSARAMFPAIALRDAIILAALAGLWSVGAPLSAGTGIVADLVGVLLGLSIGVGAFLLHEWGHLLGGLAAGATVRAPRNLRGAYLFSFDVKANSRRQFLTMSLGGFVVTAGAIVFVYGFLPDGWLATRVARGAIAFLATLTVFIEFPLVIVSLVRHQALPSVEVFKDTPPAEQAAA